MALEEIILILLVVKNVINLLPFCFWRDMQNQTLITSTLILMFTDTVITGYLMCVWFTGWTLSFGLDVVSLRFLCFMNETYWYVTLLLPWVTVNEELVCLYIQRRGNLARTTQTLFMQASLLSLACWLVAASYAINFFSGLSLRRTECDLQTWSCLLTYLHKVPNYNWLIATIGLVLGGTLSCSIFVSKHQSKGKVELHDKSYEISEKVLFILVAAVSFWVLPPFLAVSSFSALALDGLFGIFRTQSIEPLSAVHSLQDVCTGKDTKDNLTWTHSAQQKSNTASLGLYMPSDIMPTPRGHVYEQKRSTI